ncbi:hypothetical protein, partial [Limnohabitans sp.]|uniref:hypothetical protein n=1 Tax=Limnohabitans sp. TaxID=1907725 RepID=UPI00333EE79E
LVWRARVFESVIFNRLIDDLETTCLTDAQVRFAESFIMRKLRCLLTGSAAYHTNEWVRQQVSISTVQSVLRIRRLCFSYLFCACVVTFPPAILRFQQHCWVHELTVHHANFCLMAAVILIAIHGCACTWPILLMLFIYMLSLPCQLTFLLFPPYHNSYQPLFGHCEALSLLQSLNVKSTLL